MNTIKYDEYQDNLQRVSDDLNLVPENQDWGIINADHSRVNEFIDYFTNNVSWLSSSIICDIIDLIFSSYNEFLLDDIYNSALEKRFLSFVYLLKKDEYCIDTIQYWQQLASNSEFPVSKLLI